MKFLLDGIFLCILHSNFAKLLCSHLTIHILCDVIAERKTTRSEVHWLCAACDFWCMFVHFSACWNMVVYANIWFIICYMKKNIFIIISSGNFPSAKENATQFITHKSRKFKLKKMNICLYAKIKIIFQWGQNLHWVQKYRPPFWPVDSYYFCETKCWSECK